MLFRELTDEEAQEIWKENGLEQGREEGKEQGRQEMLDAMNAIGIASEEIANILELTNRTHK